jgi:ABC-type nickel/cobalt efflux system permease component RcnA
LTELTLTQDLRSLIGTLPGASREEWLSRYGVVTGPLNAKGFLVSVDGTPIELSFRGYNLAVEDHPRYTFHLEAEIPSRGRLVVRDTNYGSSEGTSRLAIRGRAGVALSGGGWPAEVDQVPIRPVWALSDEEERRTRRVEVAYQPAEQGGNTAASVGQAVREEPFSSPSAPRNGTVMPSGNVSTRSWTNVSELLDASSNFSWIVLGLIGAGLGAAHAIQPGHGKTLVTVVALSPAARSYQPALLGLATALAHTGSVLVVALVLWWTGSSQVGTIHHGLAQAAGFVIAAAGFWRLGRFLGDFPEHDDQPCRTARMNNLSLLSLGLAGGLVPCWDAVGLLLLAAALGRLSTGVGLVLAFSLGMATVLVAIGCLAWRLKSAATPRLPGGQVLQRRVGLICSGVLAVMGLWLFCQ